MRGRRDEKKEDKEREARNGTTKMKGRQRRGGKKRSGGIGTLKNSLISGGGGRGKKFITSFVHLFS